MRVAAHGRKSLKLSVGGVAGLVEDKEMDDLTELHHKVKAHN